MPQVSGGTFAPLQEDEDDDEEEAPGFQSQASAYAEKKQKQDEHEEKEKDAKLVSPPPTPQSVRPQKAKKTKRVYMPMLETEKKSECGWIISSSKTGVEPASCELEQNKNKRILKDQNYLSDSNVYKQKKQQTLPQQRLPKPRTGTNEIG